MTSAQTFEVAPSGRARCRGCGERIGKGESRFGERLPNPFGDGEMTLWFHPLCGTYKRPEPFLAALAAADPPLEEHERLERIARAGIDHRRLPRFHGVERSPSGRARCRSCRETIDKDRWRIALVFYQEGRFEPSGFIHVGCARTYFDTTDVLDRARHFSRVGETEIAEIAAELAGPPPAGD